jgi:histone H3-like centromeric protein A
LKEIRRYQRSCDLLISKMFFERLIKKIFQNMRKFHLRIQSAALSVLQETAKATIITNFADEHVIIL